MRLVLLWVIVMFNALFVWFVLQPPPAKAPAKPPADEPPGRRFEYRQTHMGSEFRVLLYSANEARARGASDAAFARIAALDAALSDYNPESELMRLCERAGGPPMRVSDDLFSALDRSLDMARRSDGAFDPTVGPVVRLWRRAQRTKQLPNPQRLAQARALVGYEKVRLDPKERTVELTQAGMKLDLGGIGKGIAASEALKAIREKGITQALVAGAGDIAVGDPPPDAQGWRIGIAPLETPDATPTRFLLLKNAAISTSGDAERFVEIDGVRYSHIVDPRTGIGVTGRSSVTVVAPEGATADSLDTAVSVLGPDKGLPLVESIDGAAALIVRKVDGRDEVSESRRMKAIPRPEHKPAASGTGDATVEKRSG